ncbi:MAG TPA: hypothetical protein VMX74_03210 [Pirellulales bacterium]|nr:hypothetical protein [Pirellulales bacterium]
MIEQTRSIDAETRLRDALAECNAELDRQVADEEGDVDVQIEQHAVAVDGLRKKTAETILAIGKHIDAVHRLLAGDGRDGAFAPWIEKRCGFSRSSAYNYLFAFRRFGEKCPTVGHFSPQALYLLSAENCPKEATQEAVSLAQQGGRITDSIARKLRTKHSASKPQQDDAPVKPPHQEVLDAASNAAASNAMNFARIAITQLKRISAQDPNREKAFVEIEKWVHGNGGNNAPPASPNSKDQSRVVPRHHIEKLHEAVGSLLGMIGRSTMTISYYHVRQQVDALVQIVGKLASLYDMDAPKKPRKKK